MGTVIIKSNKADDLLFISELARRLGLKSEISPGEESSKVDMNLETDEGIPAKAIPGIIEGMKEVRAHQQGKIKLNSVDELIDELKNE